ncbi:MAG: hypothetical protein IJA10_08850 [Lachnospiraceae bacterium]|nr:hypothetical protein [Lachnospiraceae bacterium]
MEKGMGKLNTKVDIIEKKINLDEQRDIDFQDCNNDCTEYFGKTKENYNDMAEQGVDANQDRTIDEIREDKSIYSYYCWKAKTEKLTYFW